MPDVDVSIVLVNYNGGDLLARCLASIAEAPPRRAFEVIVVDNASVDDSADRALRDHPAVAVIRNAQNVGLARAFNQGARASRGRHVLALNNDAMVTPGAIDALSDALDARPELGAVGSGIVDADGRPERTARRFPHPLNALFGRRSLLTRWLPGNPISARYLMAECEGRTEPYEVDWVSLASMMVRREAIEQVGLLDEGFFVYWVDADWCHEIRDAGWSIAAVPASRVVHEEGIRAKRRGVWRPRMLLDFHLGAYRYFRKHHLRSRWNPLAPLVFGGLMARAGVLLLADSLRRIGSRSRA